jgi:putative phosphoribosyl transferase
MLARRLDTYGGRKDVIVLALPRGGVPVAFEVAMALQAPLDVFLVRKLGVPGHEELAMGAIASDGVRIVDTEMVEALGISERELESVIQREQRELGRRERLYRGNAPPPVITDRVVILIDDGLATGSSMRATVAAVRTQAPARIVIAVPIAAPSTCAELSHEVDEIVCAVTPEPFYAVGLWYEDFSQTTDAEVCELLRIARAARHNGNGSRRRSASKRLRAYSTS